MENLLVVRLNDNLDCLATTWDVEKTKKYIEDNPHEFYFNCTCFEIYDIETLGYWKCLDDIEVDDMPLKANVHEDYDMFDIYPFGDYYVYNDELVYRYTPLKGILRCFLYNHRLQAITFNLDEIDETFEQDKFFDEE